MEKKTLLKNSFFAQFDIMNILDIWNESTTLLELARKLGLPPEHILKRVDYEYIETIKTRQNWKHINSHIKARQRYQLISNLPLDELNFAISLNGIETLSHLALHYFVSPKHGRKNASKTHLGLESGGERFFILGYLRNFKKTFLLAN